MLRERGFERNFSAEKEQQEQKKGTILEKSAAWVNKRAKALEEHWEKHPKLAQVELVFAGLLANWSHESLKTGAQKAAESPRISSLRGVADKIQDARKIIDQITRVSDTFKKK